MRALDFVLTSARDDNPTNSNTVRVPDSRQTEISSFLTIQSLTNFASVTGAITIAWKALQALDESTFTSQWTPFLLSVAWLLASLALSANAADKETRRSGAFWASVIFVGLLNMLVLFAAALGIS
jgi:hypothetical protein